MKNFLHLHFYGVTTSPWHLGDRPLGSRWTSILRSRARLLWGRGIRGPMLRQLWRAYCPYSDIREAAVFKPETHCPRCQMAEECPFNNLRGSPNEGEWKDKPRLIISNLRFTQGNGEPLRRMSINTLSDRWRGVVPEKAPITLEYIPARTGFEFEIILMGEGVRFRREVKEAVEVSLRFLGWGGRCNEGFGRGLIKEIKENMWSDFLSRYIDGVAKNILGKKEVCLETETLLLLEKSRGQYFTSVIEEGFQEKLFNCMRERYWQFFGQANDHPAPHVERVESRLKPEKIRGWSRKMGREIGFTGLSGTINLILRDPINNELARMIAVTRYGIGKYKNQGFGTLLLTRKT